MNLEHLWMYIVAPIIGSILAVFSWKLIYPEK
ncbi:MAG TPA: aquaporin, partial [Saprospirales bacterium]|nr:aquaporin [Saprospirales bacterium]